MKRWGAAVSLFVLCVSASAFVYTRLLSGEDLEFQRIENEMGVALGSGLPSEFTWDSYNQWQCFKLDVVEFDCANYDHGILVPSLRVETEEKIFLFDAHVEDRLACEHTLSVWRKLAWGGGEICIFAAHMPEVELGLDRNEAQSLWYISRLKGEGGYWSLYEARTTQ